MPKNDTLPKARFKCRANPTATFLTEKTCIARKKKPNNENSLLLDMCKGCPGPLDIDAEVDMKSNIDRLKERKRIVDEIAVKKTEEEKAHDRKLVDKHFGNVFYDVEITFPVVDNLIAEEEFKIIEEKPSKNKKPNICRDCGKKVSKDCKTGICFKCAHKYLININMTSFPEIFDEIKSRALKNNRTVYLEVLHFLKKEFGG